MRTFAYKFLVVLCCCLGLALGAVVTILVIVVLLLDSKYEGQQLIDPSALAKIQIGDVVRLSELLKEPAEQVCFLGPYQNKLAETEPLSQQVNAHLKAIGFELLDNGFALVFVHGDKVSVQYLNVGPNNVSIWFPWHQDVSRIFKPLGCAGVERALVTKSDGNSLLFGEQR